VGELAAFFGIAILVSVTLRVAFGIRLAAER